MLPKVPQCRSILHGGGIRGWTMLVWMCSNLIWVRDSVHVLRIVVFQCRAISSEEIYSTKDIRSFRYLFMAGCSLIWVVMGPSLFLCIVDIQSQTVLAQFNAVADSLLSYKRTSEELHNSHSDADVGSCWRISGSQGFLTLALAQFHMQRWLLNTNSITQTLLNCNSTTDSLILAIRTAICLKSRFNNCKDDQWGCEG